MKIGLDARKLYDGGIGSYIRGLLRAIASAPRAHRVVAFLVSKDLGGIRWPGDAISESPVRARKYGFAEHVVLARAARAAGVELFHAPHYTLPLGWNGPSVVTIHDLIHIRFPRFFPPGAALYARAVAGTACRRARLVLVNSRHTGREVVELLGVPEERMRVIPHAISPAFFPRPASQIEAFCRARALPAAYLLYVGARKPHKNLPLLLEALAILPVASRPPLVLSGEPWSTEDALARRAADFGLSDAIRFAGPLADEEEMACLYGGAALYVQPSLAEGFGLPPLEAMACGTPVLSSDAGALPETLGEAAVLLPPRSPDAWAEALQQLVTDSKRRSALRQAGLARAAGYHFERTAALTLDAYEEAARDGRGHARAASAPA